MNPTFLILFLFLTALNFCLIGGKIAMTDPYLSEMFSYCLLGFSLLLTASVCYLFRHRNSPKQFFPRVLLILLYLISAYPAAVQLTAVPTDSTETEASIPFDDMRLVYSDDNLTVSGKADFDPAFSYGPKDITLSNDMVKVTFSQSVTEPRIARVFTYHRMTYPLLHYVAPMKGTLSHYIVYIPG